MGKMSNDLPQRIRFVVASRESGSRFLSHTSLGQCLRNRPVEIRLFENNTRGLSARYNQAIEESRTSPAILVFVHDDVYLLGFYFIEEIIKGLERFEVLGIVGTKRRVLSQPSWQFTAIDPAFHRDAPQNFSGRIGLGKGSELSSIDDFGPACQEVKLLDGLLLAAHSRTLISNDLGFDERFDFHFYDMDFCREAEARRLRMGTWNISVIHEGRSQLGTRSWYEAYGRYLQKWQEPRPFDWSTVDWSKIPGS